MSDLTPKQAQHFFDIFEKAENKRVEAVWNDDEGKIFEINLYDGSELIISMFANIKRAGRFNIAFVAY